MHRGHSWVFRAEDHATMLQWFGDIKELTERKGEDRNDFVRRQHSRSLSQRSMKAHSMGGDSEGAMDEDEADQQVFSGEQSVRGQSVGEDAGLVAGAVAAGDMADNRSEAGWRPPQRPSPGGRFPSDINVQRGLQAPVSPSSGAGSDRDRDVVAAASTLPGSGVPFANSNQPHTDLQVSGNEGAGAATSATPALHHAPVRQANITNNTHEATSQYGEWMTPIAAGGAVGGAAVGAAAMHHHDQNRPEETSEQQMDAASPVPAYGTSSPPIPVVATDASVRSRGLTESTEAPTMTSAPTASTDARTISTGTTTPTEYSTRPGLEQVKTSKSVTTISDLSMPGKFPATPVLSEDVPNSTVR
jgi:hypothetical protein